MDVEDKLREQLSGASCLPWKGLLGIDRLIDLVVSQRSKTLTGVYLRLQCEDRDLLSRSGFVKLYEQWCRLSKEERDGILGWPLFRIWLDRVLEALPARGEGLVSRLGEFSRVLASFNDVDSEGVEIPGTTIRLLTTPDPMVRQALRSDIESYHAETENATNAEEEMLCAEVLSASMSRISRAWPEMHEIINRLVRYVVYVPHDRLRSVSGRDYPGIVYLGEPQDIGLGMDTVQLEELLVHECAHQILFTLDEIKPVIGESSRSYSLPWSGKSCNEFVYIHAYYVYATIVQYLLLRLASSQCDLSLGDRVGFIITGLIEAQDEVRTLPSLTCNGEQLIDAIDSALREIAMSSEVGESPHRN